ncbi:hypothetical protein DES39_1945 [Orbus hercynius]|uniref:Uncharacterized protein n=1 Tax=Orbus hercynius TaxID=593135 RepID=A0A495RBU6_9GAMM|nr:hypothetical protein [Orbus hercynius]RKS84730.1 hypothetical protein DES39_1945 [Orbus hercynius]
MKNLAIKQVAFGLLLAGYAASSAFALNASTSVTITGNAPVINSAKGVSTSTNSMDISVLSKGTTTAVTGAWSVGDTVQVTYKVNDADGDYDKELTGKTFYFTYYKDGAWATYTNTNVSVTAAAENNGTQTIKWVIPTAAVGATKIGFTARPFTIYGAPDRNNWLTVADITSGGVPGDGGEGGTDPTNPTDPSNPVTPPDNGGTGGGETPTDPEQPVQPGDSLGVKIVRVGASGAANEFQNANGPVTAGEGTEIKLTNAFEAQVWDDSADVTSDAGFKNYDWYVTGGNSAANGTVAATTDNVYFVQTGANVQYTLPATNDAAKATLAAASAAQNQGIQGNTTAGAATALSATQPEAGIQGFKLGVWVH